MQPATRATDAADCAGPQLGIPSSGGPASGRPAAGAGQATSVSPHGSRQQPDPGILGSSRRASPAAGSQPVDEPLDPERYCSARATSSSSTSGESRTSGCASSWTWKAVPSSPRSDTCAPGKVPGRGDSGSCRRRWPGSSRSSASASRSSSPGPSSCRSSTPWRGPGRSRPGRSTGSPRSSPGPAAWPRTVPGAASRSQRRDGTVLHADLLLYAITGDVKHNPYVLDGDVVRVPFQALVATIAGRREPPGHLRARGDLATSPSSWSSLAGSHRRRDPGTCRVTVVRRRSRRRS